MDAQVCSWCKTDAVESAKIHEGPHATWCPRSLPVSMSVGEYWIRRKELRAMVERIAPRLVAEQTKPSRNVLDATGAAE